MSTKILVTGGAGYIGSHVTLCLLEAGFDAVVVDNFCNSSPESLRRVGRLAGQPVAVEEADICDAERLGDIFVRHRPVAVMHFAGLKAVGESVSKPLHYYGVNLVGSLRLLDAMQRHECMRMVFSSSATVYGDPSSLPVTEAEGIKPTNPYGQTKAMIEQFIADYGQANTGFAAICLRYFNPVGAHESGCIGEDPKGRPNNLMPFVAQVAAGRRQELEIYGDDWPTSDGTGVRDYIHVMDLAEAHLAALRALNSQTGVVPINVGTGQGYSVREMVDHFERASGCPIPTRVSPRRHGDIASCYADPSRARDQLGWRANRDAAAMCEDAWRWQSNNPMGFAQ